MKLIFIWGGAASGKLTVAQKLSELTGIALFHNHLVVDALLGKYEFGAPEFVRLREAMWMTVFDTAARAGQSLIFTFAPEPTVEPNFPERVSTVIRDAGGEVKFVRLVLSRDEQERRIANPSRSQFRKLVSLDLLREFQPSFAMSEAEMPPADLVIDSEIDDPETASRRIAAAFGLATASTVS
ncbi:MAG: shikimate kinase [Hyphomonadaceae bacterium]